MNHVYTVSYSSSLYIFNRRTMIGWFLPLGMYRVYQLVSKLRPIFWQKPSDEAGYRTDDLSGNSQTHNLLRHWGHVVPQPYILYYFFSQFWQFYFWSLLKDFLIQFFYVVGVSLSYQVMFKINFYLIEKAEKSCLKNFKLKNSRIRKREFWIFL
jgi:hypothetical protein